mgnify:CR=1 FL=1
MSYQDFIIEALKETNTKPTKDDMQFAYIVLHCGLGLNADQSFNEILNLTK